MRISRRILGLAVLACSASILLAAELKPQTEDAYRRYVQITESRIDAALQQHGQLTWLERLPEDRREADNAELRNGKMIVEKLETRDDGGREIGIPGGLVHHWV